MRAPHVRRKMRKMLPHVQSDSLEARHSWQGLSLRDVQLQRPRNVLQIRPGSGQQENVHGYSWEIPRRRRMRQLHGEMIRKKITQNARFIARTFRRRMVFYLRE